MLKHILVIPDGNRRYAKMHNLDYPVVYKKSMLDITGELIKFFLIKKGAQEFTIYGLSLNNLLKRPATETRVILDTELEAFEGWFKDIEFKEHKIAVRFVGEKHLLPEKFKEELDSLELKNPKNPKKICNVLVAYDAQEELIHAFIRVKEKGIKLTADNFFKFLYIKTPINLVFRTANEQRLSGAPIYQSTQAEFIFADYFYPELDESKMIDIVKEYEKRKRSLGK